MRAESIATPARSIAQSTGTSGSSMSSISGPSSRSAMRAASGACSSSVPAARRASTASPSPSRAGHGETLLGEQVVEVVLAAARVDQVRGQLGVEGRHDAGLAERTAERLEAVGDDRRCRCPPSTGVAPLSSISSAASPRAMPSSPAPSPAMPIGPPRREQRAERGGVAALRAHGVLLALDRRARDGGLELVDAAQQRAELEAPEELAHRRAVGRVGERPAEVDIEREVALDRRQELRALGVLAVLDQRLAALLAGHGVDVREDALERAEAHEQVGGRLVADAGHARDVVGGVALEPDEVGHERGGMPSADGPGIGSPQTDAPLRIGSSETGPLAASISDRDVVTCAGSQRDRRARRSTARLM